MRLIKIEGQKRNYFVRGTCLFTSDTSNPELRDATGMSLMIGNVDGLDYFLYVDFKGNKPSGFMTLPSGKNDSESSLNDGNKVPGDYVVDSPFVPFLGWQSNVEAYKQFSGNHPTTEKDWELAKDYMTNHNYPIRSLILLDMMATKAPYDLNKAVGDKEKALNGKESLKTPKATSVFYQLPMSPKDFLSGYAIPYGRDGYNVMTIRAARDTFNTPKLLKGLVDMGMFKAAGNKCVGALATEMPWLMNILIDLDETDNPITSIPKDISDVRFDIDQIQECLEKLQKAVDYAKTLDVAETAIVPIEEYISRFKNLQDLAGGQ